MKTNKQRNLVQGLEPWDQYDKEKETKMFQKVKFWAHSETVKKSDRTW